jgi:hypothetical protein
MTTNKLNTEANPFSKFLTAKYKTFRVRCLTVQYRTFQNVVAVLMVNFNQEGNSGRGEQTH